MPDGVPVTARELLLYAAYRFDCYGQPCGGGEACEKKPTCTEVTASLRTLAARLDAATRQAEGDAKRATDGRRNIGEIELELLARLDAPIDAAAPCGTCGGTRKVPVVRIDDEAQFTDGTRPCPDCRPPLGTRER